MKSFAQERSVKIAHAIRDFDMESLQKSVQAFELGMVEVLEDIAMTHYEKHIELNTGYSDRYRKVEEERNKKFDEIIRSTPGIDKAAMLDLDDLGDWMAAVTAEEEFVAGFVQGYLFLKNLEKLTT